MISRDHWVFYLLVILMHFSVAAGAAICVQVTSQCQAWPSVYSLSGPPGASEEAGLFCWPLSPGFLSSRRLILLISWPVVSAHCPSPAPLATPPCVVNKSQQWQEPAPVGSEAEAQVPVTSMLVSDNLHLKYLSISKLFRSNYCIIHIYPRLKVGNSLFQGITLNNSYSWLV